MPRDSTRSHRIADQIQRDLSDLLRHELKDPRVELVTVTAVEVTRDLAHAKVFFTSLSEVEDKEQLVEGLQHAAGFLRSQLARTLSVRTVPQLRFVYDTSVEQGIRLSNLIDQAVAGDKALDGGRHDD